jgi:hypothetical protein
MITVYHGTSQENHDAIMRDGFIRGRAYFTPRYEIAAEYGEAVIEIELDESVLNIDHDTYDGFDLEQAISDGASLYVDGDVAV